MSTLHHNLVIRQGASYELKVQVTGGPASIAGFSAQMQVRPLRSSDEVLVDLATPPGDGLLIDAAARIITISLSSAETAALDWIHPAVYDLELAGDGQVWRVMEGQIKLSKEVTR